VNYPFKYCCSSNRPWCEQVFGMGSFVFSNNRAFLYTIHIIVINTKLRFPMRSGWLFWHQVLSMQEFIYIYYSENKWI